MVTYEIWADIDQADYWGYGGAARKATRRGGGARPTTAAAVARKASTSPARTTRRRRRRSRLREDRRLSHLHAQRESPPHHGRPEFGELTAESVTQDRGLSAADAARQRAEPRRRVLVDRHLLAARRPSAASQLVGYKDDDSDAWYWRIKQLSKITVLDITNKSASAARPRGVLRRLVPDRAQGRLVDPHGGLLADRARDHVGLVAALRTERPRQGSRRRRGRRACINKLTLADFIPQIYVRTPNGQFATNSLSRRLVPARSIARPTATRAASRRSSRSICSADSLHWDADHVVSNWSTFYASKDTLLLAEPAHDWWWYWWYQDDPDQLNIHAFDISVPGQTTLHRLGSRRRSDPRSVLARRGERRDSRRDDDRHVVAMVGG